MKLKVPNSIIIEGYIYVFKEQHKSDPTRFTYLCQKYNCIAPININGENISKLNETNKNNKTKYTLKKNHICKLETKILSEISDKCSSEEDMIIKEKI